MVEVKAPPSKGLVPALLYSVPMTPRQAIWVRLLWVTAPSSWLLICTRFCLCLQDTVSSVPRKFCNQILLASRVKFPGGSQSLCWIPRLGNLVWVLELCNSARTSLVHCSPVCGLFARWLYGGAHMPPLRSAAARSPVPTAGHC